MAETTKQRNRYRHHGTKRFAMAKMRELLRAYAKARRAWALESNPRWTIERDWTSTHGQALGALHALVSVGALTDAQYSRILARMGRISKAKVTRRPLAELRAAA